MIILPRKIGKYNRNRVQSTNQETSKTMLELRRLSVDDGPEIYHMLQDIPKEENGFVNNANGMSYEAYKEWLAAKHQESLREGIQDSWKVPSTTYWLYADDIPVGFGKLRHCLTDALRKAGGHIGYAVAPAYRGKGYGKELLRLLVQNANEMGIEKVLLTIRLNNMASQAVAFANGGVVTDRTDERLLIWIDTKTSYFSECPM